MQALHISTIMKVASDPFPIFGAEFVHKLLKLIVLFLCPPSLFNVELVKRSPHGSQVTSVIDDLINKISILVRTIGIVKLIQILAAEEFDSLF